MTRRLPITAAAIARPRRGAGGGRGVARAAFTIVELLVVIAIMIVLLGLTGAAISGARASQKRQATQLLISKLDTIVQQQLATYSSRSVPSPPDLNGDGRPDYPANMTAASYRAWYIRRNLITGDLPDRWTDVAAIASGSTAAVGTTMLPITAVQRAYADTFKNGKQPTPQYAGAECLFMIVMQGGIANCLDCADLRTAQIGDKDTDGSGKTVGDGWPEFLDEWGNPIGFILWPAGLVLPAGSASKFFTDSRALDLAFPATAGTSPIPSLGMRPLIYSAGPDGQYGFNRADEASQLTAGTGPVGRDCGNWSVEPAASMAGPDPQKPGAVVDNLTNFDAEVKK